MVSYSHATEGIPVAVLASIGTVLLPYRICIGAVWRCKVGARRVERELVLISEPKPELALAILDCKCKGTKILGDNNGLF